MLYSRAQTADCMCDTNKSSKIVHAADSAQHNGQKERHVHPLLHRGMLPLHCMASSCMQWNKRLHVHVCAATFHCNHSEQSCSTLASKFDSATLLLLGHSCQWPKQRMASSCTSLEHVLQGAESGQTLVQAPCRHHIAFTLCNNNSHWNIHDACAATARPHRIGKHIDTKARTCLEYMRTELDTGHLLPAGTAVTARARVVRRRTLEDAMVCWQTLTVWESLFFSQGVFSLFSTFFTFFRFIRVATTMLLPRCTKQVD
jgi:hypothetical protein